MESATLPPVLAAALGRLGRLTARLRADGRLQATVMTAIGPASLVRPGPQAAGARPGARTAMRYWFAGTAHEADPAIDPWGRAGTHADEAEPLAEWLRHRRATGSPALLAENLLVALLRPGVWLLRVGVIAAVTAVLAVLMQRPKA